jgi:hypothetical protein
LAMAMSCFRPSGCSNLGTASNQRNGARVIPPHYSRRLAWRSRRLAQWVLRRVLSNDGTGDAGT